VKIGIYMDAQNLWSNAREIAMQSGPGRFGIDYVPIIKMIKGGRDMAVARAFITHHRKHESEYLEQRLTAMGIECDVKYCQGDEGGISSYNNWNTDIVAKATSEQSEWDVLCLVTSNKVFVPLVQTVLEAGKQVELWGFRQHLDWAMRLQNLVGSGFSLKEIPEDMIIRSRN
jgi:uncharacterized LabA/DUF88 family protein